MLSHPLNPRASPTGMVPRRRILPLAPRPPRAGWARSRLLLPHPNAGLAMLLPYKVLPYWWGLRVSTRAWCCHCQRQQGLSCVPSSPPAGCVPHHTLLCTAHFCGPCQHFTASWSPDPLLSETREGMKEKEASLVTPGTTSHFNLPWPGRPELLLYQCLLTMRELGLREVKELVQSCTTKWKCGALGPELGNSHVHGVIPHAAPCAGLMLLHG